MPGIKPRLHGRKSIITTIIIITTPTILFRLVPMLFCLSAGRKLAAVAVESFGKVI
jgi:hypothetical protein